MNCFMPLFERCQGEGQPESWAVHIKQTIERPQMKVPIVNKVDVLYKPPGIKSEE